MPKLPKRQAPTYGEQPIGGSLRLADLSDSSNRDKILMDVNVKFNMYADMAELADALASGASWGNSVQVRFREPFLRE